MRAYVRARANKWAFDAAAEVRRGQENKAKVLSARLELERELGIELLPPSPAAERAREREPAQACRSSPTRRLIKIQVFSPTVRREEFGSGDQ